MDREKFPPFPKFQPPPPPPPSPSSGTNFPVLAISIVGIVTTAILLLSYYVFVVKCCLNWRQSDVIGRLSRSRRLRRDDLMAVYSTFAESRGLEESVIRAIPTFRYRRGAGSDADAEGKSSFHECSVCLNEFEEEERVRLLPNCFHVFHIDCIDTWLQTHDNCPLCRSEITGSSPIPIDQITGRTQPRPTDQSVTIEVRDESRGEEANTSGCSSVRKKDRKINKVFCSMGDECIDVRVKDEQFAVQPMRRSFSLGSSSDRQQLYMAVQETLRQNPHFQGVATAGEGSSSTGSGRIRRSFFSFSHCRSSRSAVLPIQNSEV